jgi:hypothetical protein
MSTKPGSLQAVSILWIIDGILTIFWGFGLVIAAFASFVGIVCLPLSIYPFVVGVIELIYGIRLASSRPTLARPPYYVAVLEIVLLLWADVIGFIIGVVALVLLNGEDVKAFLSGQPSVIDRPS